MSVSPLSAMQLYTPCPPELFAFASSRELAAGTERIEQQRAARAMELATAIGADGFNLFVMGAPGSGRHTLVRHHLDGHAPDRPTPPDWCYVHNFELPHKPWALRFEPGVGRRFSAAMAQLLEDLKSTVPALFEGEDYQTRRHAIEAGVKQRQDEALSALRDKAREQGIAFMTTPGGFAFAPLQDGEVMPPDAFHKLTGQQQEEIESRVAVLQKELQETVRQFPNWMKEARRRIKQLDQEMTRAAVVHLVEAVAHEFGADQEVADYLQRLLDDVVDNAELFRGPPEGAPPFMATAEPPLERYQVNLLVSHGENGGAPVIFADHPSYANLIGRIEHQAQFGALRTDFTLIKPGLLHEANGGFLIIDAARLLVEPFAWDALKRVLRSRELKLEPLDQRLSLISTVSLEPEPIPVQVKVVLIGDRYLYYLMSQLDPDFAELFKVVADFDDDIQRTPDNVQRLATTVAHLAESDGLLPLDGGGMARVVEHTARLAVDTQKLSARISPIRDL
ncbi:MAG: ATP-binding protein, partial [Pseudomonadota bacterium]|nr:ATP-binding protein [Pseudomonadota bacterium]